MFAEWSLASYWNDLLNGDSFTWGFTVLIAVMLIGSTLLGWKSEEMPTEYDDNSDSVAE